MAKFPIDAPKAKVLRELAKPGTERWLGRFPNLKIS